MKTEFLPDNYDEIKPSSTSENSSRYTRFSEGITKIRVLSSAIVGWEAWTEENKPIRFRTRPQDSELPRNIRVNDWGKPALKFFWAFVVWNYETEQIELCEITQRAIRDGIEALIKDEDFGPPNDMANGYGIKITREGTGLDTKYSVTPGKVQPIADSILKAWEACPVNLHAIYDGADPFEPVEPDDIAF